MISTPALSPTPAHTKAASVPDLLASLEDTFLAQTHDLVSPASLYEPIHYLMGLKAKRVRPLLVVLAHQGWAPVGPEALRLAVAVEYFHNFTLVHDDIMDNAPTRRGQPTLHTQWNTNVAILAGDAMFAHSVRLAAEAFPSRASLLVGKLAEVARVVCEGQARDMDYTAAEGVTVEAYLEMIAQKTAWLIGGALWMGAASAGASTPEADALFTYGLKVGTAFQVMDDLLDTYADEADLGKKVGGDIIEGKNTYLWLRALQKANTPTRRELLYWRGVQGMDEEKVAQVRRIYTELGVPQDTRTLVEGLYAEAEAAFGPLAKRPTLAPLHQYITNLTQRSS